MRKPVFGSSHSYNSFQDDLVLKDQTEGFPGDACGKEPAYQSRRHEDEVRSLDWEDTLQEGMATHSTIFIWRIPWTEDPGGL